MSKVVFEDLKSFEVLVGNVKGGLKARLRKEFKGSQGGLRLAGVWQCLLESLE